LEALLKALLLQFGFSLVLVKQLLSLHLIGFQQGHFGDQTFNFSRQRRIISCEVVNPGLQR
jgi:hypothetical protein